MSINIVTMTQVEWDSALVDAERRGEGRVLQRTCLTCRHFQQDACDQPDMAASGYATLFYHPPAPETFSCSFYAERRGLDAE